MGIQSSKLEVSRASYPDDDTTQGEMNMRKLSLQRPQKQLEPTFHQFENAWLVPLLLRRNLHPQLCNAVIEMEVFLDLTAMVERVVFIYPSNLLSHVLRGCTDKVVAINFTFNTKGYPELLKKHDPELYDLAVKQLGKVKEIGHANALLIYTSDDQQTLNIEHFEPHGESINLGDMNVYGKKELNQAKVKTMALYKKMIDELPKEIMKVLDDIPIKEVKYYPPSAVCPKGFGPQVKEAQISQSLGMNGYCQTWSWAWVDLRMQNKHLTPRALLAKLVQKSNQELFNFVMDYAYYARNVYYSAINDPKFYEEWKKTESFIDEFLYDVESYSGMYATSIIDAIIKCIMAVRDSSTFVALRQILPLIFRSPDDWSMMSKIVSVMTNTRMSEVYIHTVSDFIKKSGSNSYSTSQLLKTVEKLRDEYKDNEQKPILK